MEEDENEKHLSKGFDNIFDWFMDKKLNIYFGKDKTKSVPLQVNENQRISIN